MLQQTNRSLMLPSMLVCVGRRALLMVSSVGLLLVMMSATASAAQPTVEQCLEASDRSLELETQEQLLATRDALRVCASLGCPHEVRDECARRFELVEQNIPGVVCEVRDETGRIRHDAQVTMDGQGPPRPAHELIELEPGSHTLTAQAPGALSQTVSVTARAREKNRLVRILLQSSAPPRPRSAGLAPRRAAALVVGGVSVASLATASIFAVIALNRKQEAQALCPAVTCSSQGGVERWDSAWQAGNFATGFMVGGVVALGAAAGLWFSFDESNTEVALGPAQVQVRARF